MASSVDYVAQNVVFCSQQKNGVLVDSQNAIFSYLLLRSFLYTPTLAARASGAVRRASATRPKYSRYE